ncbi:MAG TPA: NAD(P)-dependent oxidoreductase [Actinomycetota bacterium]|jgi:3-hydroxyisobutyrate dehydrogenase-like beta-hydroxyacid dehydrogenase|nr:NAD(P)-dependent oxidoreductase [Actinomycetota bacterium]
MTTVAVLGTGRMGGAMVGTLSRAGFDVVAWNRSSGKVAHVAASAGANVADSPTEAIRDADVVVSSLADDAAVESVFGQTTDALHESQVVLEMSTISPVTTRRVGERVLARGAGYLDAPVSGSVSLVEAGNLTIMVGGDGATLDRGRPVLEALAGKILHVGALGAGATMKLAVNGLVHGLNVALSESLVLAERAGVDRSEAYEVFASGAAAAPFVLYKRAAYERPDDTPVAFSLELVAKDLDLILGLADDVGLPLKQAMINREAVDEAISAGLGERDLSALAVHLRSLS